MTSLSVNVNKIALLRNSRGNGQPNLLKVALDIERFGAHGITVHPRPDGRHILYQDVFELKAALGVELNVEGNPEPAFVDMVLAAKPAQVTLVPDAPQALTSNSGWDTVRHEVFLRDVIQQFKGAGIRTSIFINAEPRFAEGAAQVGADRVELYTEPYAAHYYQDREMAVASYVETARAAQMLGLEVNAGHDLNLDNLRFLKHKIPFLAEVSIGHALVADALYLGLENTVRLYLRELREPV